MTTEANTVKSCFLFKVASDFPNHTKPKRFRDPLALSKAGMIVAHLRGEGFRVTDQQPGKACDAGFTAIFPRFRIEVILLAEHHSDSTEYAIVTWYRKLFFLSVSVQSIHEQWTKLCVAIDQILRRDSTVTSLSWMTEEESEACCSKDLSSSSKL